MGPLVVAVSGTSGAGKSTLVRDLSEMLRELGYRLQTVHFDDFTDETDLPGGDVSGWLARGAQPHEWRTDGMERHLRLLLNGCTDAIGTGRVGPDEAGGDRAVSVVLVEEPFGRSRPGFGRLVDLSVHLQVPLHLALARRLLREFIPSAGALDESSTANLRLYLSRYLTQGADIYNRVEAAATENADVVLDGRAHRDVLAKQALEAIAERL